ncbi:MAG: sugar-binding protein [Bifidobacteriaceae bacterium]|jgi:putative multiple sugar transport system substrate-binding protein|nr:sugar-binding protein [Bifidobacteriaceae bacterium]
MMHKKYLRLAAVLVAAGSLALAGCSGSPEAEDDAAPAASGEVEEPAAEEPPAAEDTPAADDAAPSGAGAACSVAAGDLVAVSMPWVGTQNFAEAVAQFPAAIEAAGYTATVLAADNKATVQQQQIDTFVSQGAKVIIVGAVDGKQLGTVLEGAKAAGICVIGYDRLLEETDAVDGVVQYGSFETGILQADALLQGLEEKVGSGPHTIELFAGGPTDPNAKFFFDGAMSVLQPLIDDGTLVIGSGQVDFAEVATADWDNGKAQTRMDSLLAGFYGDGEGPVGVLAPNDGIARAIITASENAGVAIPIVDGLDAEDESVQWVREGKQYATVAKPTAPLIDEALRLVKAAETDGVLPAPTSTTENGMIDNVGLYELTPVIVTQSNVDEYFPEDAE